MQANVAMQGLAHPGPSPFFLLFSSFLFLSARVAIPWAGPSPSEKRPSDSRPNSPFKFNLNNFLFLLTPVHQIAFISSFINPNEMKPVTLEREFEYLSHATGPIFLGFFYNLW
jgi:hypothetical protein